MYSDTFAGIFARLEKTAFAHDRLQSLRCAIVGAGALGNEAARVLALLGVGAVTVVDPDHVEPSNLSRAIFFNPGDRVGENKAVALSESAQAMFPNTRWTSISEEIAGVGFLSLREFDLIFSCVDSDLARLEIAYIGKAIRIPVVDGGLGRQNYSHGRVSYFPGSGDQACFACLLSASARAELLQHWRAIARPCSGATEGDSDHLKIASTPMMAGIVAGIQVERGLRAILDNPAAHASSIEITIHPAVRIDEIRLDVSATCPFHEVQEYRMPAPAVNATFQQMMDAADSDLLILDWPVCTGVRCLACGFEWSPRSPLARLRRTGKCRECGGRNLLELEIVRAIDRESGWLRSTPAELQLPPNHLYRLRPRSAIP